MNFRLETYDAIIAVGAIATNHITDVAIPEIFRITKKGKKYSESPKKLRKYSELPKNGNNFF